VVIWQKESQGRLNQALYLPSENFYSSSFITYTFITISGISYFESHLKSEKLASLIENEGNPNGLKNAVQSSIGEGLHFRGGFLNGMEFHIFILEYNPKCYHEKNS